MVPESHASDDGVMKGPELRQASSCWPREGRLPIMPERYEREIEDILRNVERTRPKPSLGERLHLRRRGQSRQPERLRPRSRWLARHLRFSTSEWCVLSSTVLGLVAAGIAYTSGGGTVLTGILAVLAMLGTLLGMLTFWRAR